METTAERLNKAMKIRGMKQIELSGITGIGKSSISTYLSGDYVPKQKNLHKIAQALGVSEAWLMGADVPMERKVDFGTIPEDYYFKKVFNDDVRNSVVEELGSLGYEVNGNNSGAVTVTDKRSNIKWAFSKEDFIPSDGEIPSTCARRISDMMTGNILKKYKCLSKSDKQIVDIILNRSEKSNEIL